MTDQTSAKQKAEERYPMEGWELGIPRMIRAGERSGFATCYREEVEPRDRIIQELREAGDAMYEWIYGAPLSAGSSLTARMATERNPLLEKWGAILSKIKSTYNISPKP